jgi:hypothetical protein
LRRGEAPAQFGDRRVLLFVPSPVFPEQFHGEPPSLSCHCKIQR